MSEAEEPEPEELFEILVTLVRLNGYSYPQQLEAEVDCTPIDCFEVSAKSQICKKMLEGENYDYLKLFEFLGRTGSFFKYTLPLALNDETFEIKLSWKLYRAYFNHLVSEYLDVHNFLPLYPSDDEIFHRVFLRKDLLH